MTNQELFIADGRFFNSFEEVEDYAKMNGYKISNSEVINTKKGTRHLIALNR
jgi:hypothetical protein